MFSSICPSLDAVKMRQHLLVTCILGLILHGHAQAHFCDIFRGKIADVGPPKWATEMIFQKFSISVTTWHQLFLNHRRKYRKFLFNIIQTK